MGDRTSTVDNTMRVVPGRSGSFLCPPGHPTHFHGIEAGPRNNPNLIAGLDYALRNEYGDVPDRVRDQVQKLYDEATPVCSELWMAHVYAYFRNCYSPDGIVRDVSELLIGAHAGPPEHHAGYLMVKQYFPDHQVRQDLIDNPHGYGSQPCTKCGTRLQYEARVDAFAEAITAKLDCPFGGHHLVAEGVETDGPAHVPTMARGPQEAVEGG